MKKPLPRIKKDKDFIDFVEKTDLGDYLEVKDLKGVNFSLNKQDRMISLRLSSKLLIGLKKAAQKHKTQYQKLIRAILEENIRYYL